MSIPSLSTSERFIPTLWPSSNTAESPIDQAHGSKVNSVAKEVFSTDIYLHQLNCLKTHEMHQNLDQHLQPTQIKLLCNSLKALTEHSHCLLATDGEVESPLNINFEAQPLPLEIKWGASEAYGRRMEMEDAHLSHSFNDGQLAAVFDGHGDKGKLSKFCSQRTPQLFCSELKFNPPQIALQSTLNSLHSEAFGQYKFIGGSTALLCYIEKQTNYIYTATLGDSEAKIYRKRDEKWYTIPLSCLRNWNHPKEKARVEIANEIYRSDANLRSLNLSAKISDDPLPYLDLYLGNECFSSINVSRSLLDRNFSDPFNSWLKQTRNQKCPDIYSQQLMSQKAKVTLQQLQQGDILLLASDGLWNFVDEESIVKILGAEENIAKTPKEIADQLLSYAMLECWSSDNITAVVVRC